ncbi:hypothetical protein KC19_VG074600 [Ceratodon purpureus]|uniref:Uncharacterized protein n=2 Tax=Ceratodon purpureus TaxID=3225 RepID=A0A8T0HMX8_CERPU|nr:hypothetical protein KC19_VG074600 [Ceratodon purpureus]
MESQQGDSNFLTASLVSKAASIQAKALVHDIHSMTAERGLEYQRMVFLRMLEQPLLQPILPNFVIKRKKLQDCQVVCTGVANAWSDLKYKVGRDRSLARAVIEAAVMCLEDERCVQAAAKCIGMNRKTLRRGVRRRRLLNQRADGEFWAKVYRKKRKDVLSQTTIDTVVCWWEEETKVSPCKKDIRREWVGVKEFVTHATHWLEESQLDFYTRFVTLHAPIKVSLTSFRRLKPYFVRRLRDLNACCCRYNIEMQEITVGWNTMRSQRVHLDGVSGSCSCGCPSMCTKPVDGAGTVGVVRCQSTMHSYKRATHLWEKTLCPKPTGSEWHRLKCVKGQCNTCGFHLLPICEAELEPESNKSMTWRRFEMIQAGESRSGDPRTVIRLEYKVTNPWSFLAYTKPKILQFVLHQFVAKWQDTQFKKSLDVLKDGEVMSLIDFAENYSFKGQDEIQSQHWFNFQLTILVHITYRKNLSSRIISTTSRTIGFMIPYSSSIALLGIGSISLRRGTFRNYIEFGAMVAAPSSKGQRPGFLWQGANSD